MADRIRVSDLDFVYISYKEPNKEENWADLLSKVPWAKRVDGVEGSDAAHKAAGECANTERFVLVDGDNIVDADDIYPLDALRTKHITWGTAEWGGTQWDVKPADIIWNETIWSN